jgi:hypothetical protein
MFADSSNCQTPQFFPREDSLALPSIFPLNQTGGFNPESFQQFQLSENPPVSSVLSIPGVPKLFSGLADEDFPWSVDFSVSPDHCNADHYNADHSQDFKSSSPLNISNSSEFSSFDLPALSAAAPLKARPVLRSCLRCVRRKQKCQILPRSNSSEPFLCLNCSRSGLTCEFPTAETIKLGMENKKRKKQQKTTKEEKSADKLLFIFPSRPFPACGLDEIIRQSNGLVFVNDGYFAYLSRCVREIFAPLTWSGEYKYLAQLRLECVFAMIYDLLGVHGFQTFLERFHHFHQENSKEKKEKSKSKRIKIRHQNQITSSAAQFLEYWKQTRPAFCKPMYLVWECADLSTERNSLVYDAILSDSAPVLLIHLSSSSIQNLRRLARRQRLDPLAPSGVSQSVDVPWFLMCLGLNLQVSADEEQEPTDKEFAEYLSGHSLPLHCLVRANCAFESFFGYSAHHIQRSFASCGILGLSRLFTPESFYSMMSALAACAKNCLMEGHWAMRENDKFDRVEESPLLPPRLPVRDLGQAQLIYEMRVQTLDAQSRTRNCQLRKTCQGERSGGVFYYFHWFPDSN